MNYKLDVCILSNVHGCDDTRIYHKEAKSLSKNGYKVFLIAKKSKSCYIDNEYNSISLIVLKDRKNRLYRFLFTSLQVLYLGLRINADIYHFHDPELIPTGIILKIVGKKVIYDVHEDVPKQIQGKEWIWRPLRATISIFINLIEKAASKHFNAIITTTSSIAEMFYGKNKNVFVVQNFPILSKFKGIIPHEKPYMSRLNYIAYIGGITEMRGIREVVNAIGLIEKSYQHKLILGGKFESNTFEREITSSFEWSLVCFKGWLNRDQVYEVLQKSRVGIVLLHPASNYIQSQPVKMYEYMAAGIPVIASDFPLWKEIIDGNRCGLTVDPEDPVAIANSIKYIFDHPEEAEAMGNRGRQAVQQKYNWQNEEKKLLELYAKLS